MELKKVAASFLFLLYAIAGWSQGELDTQEKLIFQNERSISLSINSNGFSAGYRFGKRLTYLNKALYDIDIAYIKHPKEVRISASPNSYSSNLKYVYGKTNIFVVLRPSIGFQREIFSKEDKGSIAVKYYYGGGPSIGITKPIYYNFDVIAPINGINYIVATKAEKFQFSQTQVTSEIAGRASFWKGFNELSIYPGLQAKAGMSFEFGSNNRLINALDVKMVLDAFLKKIPIMYTQYNNQFFLTLSLSYRFGWLVSPKSKPAKITKEGKRRLRNNKQDSDS